MMDAWLTGSSFPATPLVAGLVAYLRGLPLTNPNGAHPQWVTDLENPRNVKALIQHLSRDVTFAPINAGQPVNPIFQNKGPKPLVWNGMVYENNCFLDSKIAGGNGFDGDGMFPLSLPSFPRGHDYLLLQHADTTMLGQINATFRLHLQLCP